VAVAALGVGAVLMGGQAALTTPSPPPRSDGDRGEYAFLGRSGDGSPYGWDPCTPIRFEVDLAGQRYSALGDIRQAVQLTAVASGLRFEFVGLVEDSSPRRIIDAMSFVSPKDDGALGWSPLLITFASDRELRRIGVEDVIARAFPVASISDREQIVSGLIVVNADALLAPGFGSMRSLGPVLEHELGHILGLAHANQAFQLMYETPVSPRWNDGDRTGLRLLASRPCLASPAPLRNSSIMAF
jgi:hypothetical protein